MSTVTGLDEPWTGAPDAARGFRDAASAQVRVVLCHSPDALPLLEGRGVSLFVCGHTHGGHVALPWGPVIVPGPIGEEMPAGFYEAHGAQVFVSRGLGGIELPFRTFAPPDIGIFTLTA